DDAGQGGRRRRQSDGTPGSHERPLSCALPHRRSGGRASGLHAHGDSNGNRIDDGDTASMAQCDEVTGPKVGETFPQCEAIVGSREVAAMLTIAGPSSRYCDQLSRRNCLRIGALALGGLALPDILRGEAARRTPNAAKGIIMVLLPGGPSHLDTFDLKPDAPAEIRGEFRPLATKVPGVAICELLPRLAKLADKYALIRSLVGFRDDHNTHWCTTGWESHPAMESSPVIAGFPPGDWPSLGAVLSRQLGPRVLGVPPSVDLTPIDADARFILRTPPGQPGYLGAAHAGFEAQAVDRRNIMLNGVSLDRLADRRTLLASFDQFRRQVDQSGAADGIDAFQRQAFEVLTSPRLAK